MRTVHRVPKAKRGPAWYAAFGAILGAADCQQITWPTSDVTGPHRGGDGRGWDRVENAIEYADIVQLALEELDERAGR